MSACAREVAAAFIARVGVNVRRLRKTRGMTLSEVSRRSGLHLRHVQKLESGQLNTTIHTIVRVAIAFGVTAPEIVDTTDEEPPRR